MRQNKVTEMTCTASCDRSCSLQHTSRSKPKAGRCQHTTTDAAQTAATTLVNYMPPKALKRVLTLCTIHHRPWAQGSVAAQLMLILILQVVSFFFGGGGENVTRRHIRHTSMEIIAALQVLPSNLSSGLFPGGAEVVNSHPWIAIHIRPYSWMASHTSAATDGLKPAFRLNQPSTRLPCHYDSQSAAGLQARQKKYAVCSRTRNVNPTARCVTPLFQTTPEGFTTAGYSCTLVLAALPWCKQHRDGTWQAVCLSRLPDPG